MLILNEPELLSDPAHMILIQGPIEPALKTGFSTCCVEILAT
jgi:hypothetical protein